MRRKFRHMPGKQRFTAAQMIAALKATHGMVYLAAKRLKCDPDTVLNYCKRYPSVEAVKQAQRGELVDLAEEKLRASIQNGEAWGIAFCLKTLGKERGYVERQEVSGTDGAPLPPPMVIYLPSKAPSAEQWAEDVKQLLPPPSTGPSPSEDVPWP
jgi:hypothetical protein